MSNQLQSAFDSMHKAFEDVEAGTATPDQIDRVVRMRSIYRRTQHYIRTGIWLDDPAVDATHSAKPEGE